MKTYSTLSEKLILDDLGAIYITIPKTGCTSIKKFFSDYYGWAEVDNVHNTQSEIYNHIINDDIDIDKYHGYYVFTFIRNPFSRLYSAFKSKVRPGIVHPNFIDGIEQGLYKRGIRANHNFSDFTRIICSIPDETSDIHVKSQWQFIYKDPMNSIINQYYRFEDFENEMSKLVCRIGLKFIGIPHANKTQINPDEYKNHYDNELIEMVIKRYEGDFEYFDYKKGI